MTLTPQASTVLGHLQQTGSISPVEASACHKVRHLPARIHELRAAGFPIASSTRRDAAGQRYVRYMLTTQEG